MRIQTLILAWLAGAALGSFFFGGLWWTVRAFAGSARGVRYLVGSQVLRMGVTVVGFYLVAGGQWQSMLFCLLGFMMTRAAVLYLDAAFARKESPHAPES